jgi:hypothetical protein
MVRLGKLRQAKPKTKATARQAWQDTDRRSTRDVRSGNHDAAKAGGGRATSSRNFLTPLALRVCCAGLFGCQFGEPVPITPQIGRFWERLVTCLAQGALGLVRLRNVDQRPRRGCKCALTNRGSPLVWFLPPHAASCGMLSVFLRNGRYAAHIALRFAHSSAASAKNRSIPAGRYG